MGERELGLFREAWANGLFGAIDPAKYPKDFDAMVKKNRGDMDPARMIAALEAFSEVQSKAASTQG